MCVLRVGSFYSGDEESCRRHLTAIDAESAPARLTAAMGGASLHDATFLRLLARGFEEIRDPEHVIVACKVWEDFRRATVQEGMVCRERTGVSGAR